MKKILKIIGISLLISNLFLFTIKSEINIYYIDKIIITTTVLSFFSFMYTFGIKKVFDYIIDHRFKIAIIFLIVTTLLQYSGSSNCRYAEIIGENEYDSTLVSGHMAYHSDEYALETNLAISQKNNDFKQSNEYIRGIPTDVFSVVHAPVKDIIAIGRIFNLGYLFLPSGMGLAFFCNLRLVMFLLVTFELMLILTNKNRKISIIATLILVFSGVFSWINTSCEYIIWGELIIVLLDKFMTTQKQYVKYLSILGISIAILNYIFTIYLPWIISFGYIFIALAIWIIAKNIKEYKFKWKDLAVITVAIAFVIGILYRYYLLSSNTINEVLSTSYPGKRNQEGGKGLKQLFSYLYNFLLPYVNVEDNCEVASIISIFPLPLFYSIWYIMKKEKHYSFFIPTIIICVFETLYCIFGFPVGIEKATLFNYTTSIRTAVAVSLINFYMLIYIISNVEPFSLETKHSIRLTLLFICLLVIIPFPQKFSSRILLVVFTAIYTTYIYLFLNYENQKYKNVLLYIMLLFTIIGAIGTNPITKGVDAITKTNYAKVIREISSNNKDALWISIEEGHPLLANYAVANNAKVINSTNIYPNKEFYKKVLGEENYKNKEYIWNRYAHIVIELSNVNDIELMNKDKVLLKITPEKIKELDIEYILTNKSEKEFEEKGIIVENILKNEAKDETKYIHKIKN